MLEIRNLNKSYRIDKIQNPVLKNINLKVEQGVFAALVGPSGCGKSTLLNLIGGLDTADNGEILFNGENILEYSEKQLENYRLQNIGTIFQSFNLIGHLSVQDNVELPMKLAGVSKEERSERAKELLELVGLSDKLKYKPNQLSGGQKQRVAIARALSLKPRLILADEPTGALDTQTGKQILDLLQKVVKETGTTIIMVTHAPDIAAQADHIIGMVDGEIIREKHNRQSNTVESNGVKPKKHMSFKSAVQHAYQNMLLKKWRTLLVSIGASIGITGIALVVGMGMNIEDFIKDQVQNFLGENSIQVFKSEEEQLPLLEKDIEKIRDIEGVKEAYNYYSFFGDYTYEEKEVNFLSIESLKPTEIMTEEDKEKLLAGEYADEEDEIVISEGLVNLILEGEEGKNEDFIGKDITVKVEAFPMSFEKTEEPESTIVEKTYTITGVATADFDAATGFITYESAINLSKELNDGVEQPLNTAVQAEDAKYVSDISKELRNMGFFVITLEDVFKEISKFSMIGQVVLGSFAGISLIVSTIMIGIVMYISVLERTKEIGILRAVGARRKDIRRIFLAEAGTIGFISASIGILIAIGISLIGNLLLNSFIDDIGFSVFGVPITLVLFCLLFSTGISVLAGWLPALKASRLNPVDALRHE